MSNPTIHYRGDGTEFHHGIPARDLTTEEYDALDTEQRALVRKSPLYDYAAYHDAITPKEAVKAAPAKTVSGKDRP